MLFSNSLVESLESLASVLAENNEVGENTTILSVTGNRSAIVVERVSNNLLHNMMICA